MPYSRARSFIFISGNHQKFTGAAEKPRFDFSILAKGRGAFSKKKKKINLLSKLKFQQVN